MGELQAVRGGEQRVEARQQAEGARCAEANLVAARLTTEEREEPWVEVGRGVKVADHDQVACRAARQDEDLSFQEDHAAGACLPVAHDPHPSLEEGRP